MLRSLTVRDFVIVDSLELDFASGFSALTGETGAGKSILIDALQLTLGSRGDAGAVREGAVRADVSAEFSINDAAIEWLKANEIGWEDDVVLMRRTVDSSGRSRGFVNGIAVTASQMRELASLLVDIHGQHAHQLLLKTDEQRLLLDRHAGIEPQLKELASLFSHWQNLIRAIHNAETDSQKLLSEKERLEWQVNELEKLGTKAGEWEQINSDYDRLSHMASLIEGSQETLNKLVDADSSLISSVNALQQRISRLAGFDSRLEPVTELLDSARIQLQEAAYGLRDYLSRTDMDPALLEKTEKRLEALHFAARQFNVPPERLHEELESRKNLLVQYEQAADLDELRKKEANARHAYFDLAATVAEKRRQAAKELGDAVTAVMADLHMSGGRFAVEVRTGAAHAYGTEQIEFLVAGHAGTELRPLAKVASGGELARISLAISVIASRATTTPTLIFDEVDSGIGGAVAEVVGQLLKRLGKEHQVLCVTHLPQVASQARQHFQISKVAVDYIQHPVSRITSLTGEERVVEIARMLGGLHLTETTLEHAREMLKQE